MCLFAKVCAYVQLKGFCWRFDGRGENVTVNLSETGTFCLIVAVVNVGSQLRTDEEEDEEEDEDEEDEEEDEELLEEDDDELQEKKMIISVTGVHEAKGERGSEGEGHVGKERENQTQGRPRRRRGRGGRRR